MKTPDQGLLSPFRADRNALTACLKVAESPIEARQAILIDGFDDSRRPFADIIGAFEILARSHVNLGPRHASWFGPLVHPVHANGETCAREILREAHAACDAG